MKRKPTLIILSLIAAFSLLAVTAFANAPDYAGYEAFKTLASEQRDKDFGEEENGTLKGSIIIKDNDVTLLDLDAYLKADGVSENFSGAFSLNADGTSKDINVYAADDIVYIFDEANNEYYQVNKSDEYDDMNEDYQHGTRNEIEDISPAQEELLDFVVGELKNDFELVNNSDGSETIKFELTKDEIPMLLNLMFSAMDHDKSDMHGDGEDLDAEVLAKYPLLSDLNNINVEIPEITENMELDYVKFAITTDVNDEFQAVEFDFKVTGDDELGDSHKLQISGKFAATDVGTTVVETPDLEGKKIIVVDEEDFQSENMQMHRGPKGRR